MAVKQKTLANSFTIQGKGLHTGVNVTMNFLPAPVNHGFKFKRIDLENQPIIEADVSKIKLNESEENGAGTCYSLV